MYYGYIAYKFCACGGIKIGMPYIPVTKMPCSKGMHKIRKN